jgi:hypothetical protein
MFLFDTLTFFVTKKIYRPNFHVMTPHLDSQIGKTLLSPFRFFYLERKIQFPNDFHIVAEAGSVILLQNERCPNLETIQPVPNDCPTDHYNPSFAI